MTSCHPENSERFQHISDIPVIIQGDSLWSMYSIHGTFRFEDRLKNFPSLVINDHFSMINPDGTYSLYKLTDKPVPLVGCGRLTSVGYYNEGLIPVSFPGSRIKLLDEDGNVRFELKPYKGEEIRGCANSFFDGRLRVLTPSGKYGYIDKNGKYIIDPQYNMARDFSEGVAVVGHSADSYKKFGGRFSVIDTQGKILFTVKPDLLLQTYRYSEGKLVVKKMDQMGFIDKKGAFTKSLDSAIGIGQYDDKYYVFANKKGLWGVADYKGKIIIDPLYESIEILPDQTFLVEKNNKQFLVLDRMDNVKINFTNVDQVKYYRNLGFLVKDANGISLRNTNGVRTCDKYFSDVSMERTVGSFVRSDIFKKMDLFQQFIASLNARGIGIYNLNAPATNYVSAADASKYTFSKTITSDKIFYSNEDHIYRFNAITDKPIAMPDHSDPDKSILNPNAKIIVLKLEIGMSPENWESSKMELARKLQNKGFNLVKTYLNKECTYKLYQTINSELILEENTGKNIVTVYLFADRQAESFRRMLFGH